MSRKKWVRTAGIVAAFLATVAIVLGIAHAEFPLEKSGPETLSRAAKKLAGALGARKSKAVLAKPPLQGWPGLELGRKAAKLGSSHGKYPMYALANTFDAHIYLTAKPSKLGRGLIRLGNHVRVKAGPVAQGCSGRWYEVMEGGYICDQDGFVVGDAPAFSDRPPPPPALDSIAPYPYAQVTRQGAGLFSSMETVVVDPSEDDGIVMEGDYFLAVEPEAKGAVVRTVDGKFVRREDLKSIDPPTMHGEILSSEGSLPMAFVHEEDIAAARLEGGKLTSAGEVDKHARFAVKNTRRLDGKVYLETPDGLWIPKDATRIARKASRPEKVGSGEPWVHIDLDQQTLVAYEGDRPVFATLVSSGKEGYDTPDGLYRVRHKYISITMSGDDPIDGYYHVEEVPWTMYYYGNYALHGAYWHEDFGNVRSHGCTNLAPADARWLYHWTAPEVPEGWHGVQEEGTWVYFSRES